MKPVILGALALCALTSPSWAKLNITHLGMGVTAKEDATGLGYIVFNPNGLNTRLTLYHNSSHEFVAIYRSNDQWFYYENENPHPFTPTNTDIIVAQVNYTSDTATPLQGQNNIIHGIRAGYASGNLTVTANQYNGVNNPGEFGLAGTHIQPNDPTWWATRGVKSTNPESNLSPANLGQLKHLSTQAKAELDSILPGGTSYTLPFAPPPPNPNATWYENQKKILNLGQLKHTTQPLYDQLNNINPDWVKTQLEANGLNILGTDYFQDPNNGFFYPWDPTTPVEENLKPTVIGQLKLVFGLRFRDSNDGDSIPDIWEYSMINAHPEFGITNIVSLTDTGDEDLDSVSNLEEYQNNLNPFLSHTHDGLIDRVQIGLVGNWKLDESAGNTVLEDSSSNDLDGELLSGTRIADGVSGSAVALTTFEQMRITPAPGQLNVGENGSAFTVSFWMRLHATQDPGYNIIFQKGNINQSRTFHLSLRPDGQKLHARLSSDTSLNEGINQSTHNMIPGNWTHVSYVHGNGQLKLYINGQLDSSAAVGQSISNDDPFYIGKSATGFRGINADFDEIKVHRRALSNEEVAALSESELSDSDGDGLSNLVEFQLGTRADTFDTDGDGYSDFLSVYSSLFITFDELNGNSVPDSSAAQNNGTLVASPNIQVGNGVSGSSLKFNGNDDAVMIPPEAINGYGNLSLSLWFKTTSSSLEQALLSAANEGNADEFAVTLRQETKLADTVRVHSGQGVSFDWQFDRSLADGLWHHLVVVRDLTNSSISIYLDGQRSASKSFTSQQSPLSILQLVLAQKHSSLNAYKSASAFAGELDEIRISNKLFSDSSVAELFQPNDLDGDRLPDDYELAKTGNLSTLISLHQDYDGDGLTNIIEIASESDPLDYYNGKNPVITLISGNAQTILNGQTTPDPLIFKITTDGSTPLVGAPVTVKHLGSLGQLQNIIGQHISSSENMITDSNGEVSIYFKAN